MESFLNLAMWHHFPANLAEPAQAVYDLKKSIPIDHGNVPDDVRIVCSNSIDYCMGLLTHHGNVFTFIFRLAGGLAVSKSLLIGRTF
jgi:hypothetical protein